MSTFIGPTLDMIGYDAASYNAGAAAGYDAGAQQASPTPAPANDWLAQNQTLILAGAGVLLLAALIAAARR